MTPAHATRHQFASPDGAVEAVVSSRAAALCALRVRGVDLIDPAGSAGGSAVAGAVLAPWPNRVDGATWDLNGRVQSLTVTEPEFGHAIHGLVLGRNFEVTEARGELTLRTELSGAPGYPFRIHLEVRYKLEDSGIVVTHRIRNLSEWDAPVALGAHPYLRAGPLPVEDLTLTVAAERALVLDDTHVPRGGFAVAGTAWDLRTGRRVNAAMRHATYEGLALHGGRFVHRLSADDGTTTELWADADFAWLQIYISSRTRADDRALTIAIEPMTAPPNALRSGDGLRWLTPGEVWELNWGIRRAGLP
jgi:aldose 1-epimerase